MPPEAEAGHLGTLAVYKQGHVKRGRAAGPLPTARPRVCNQLVENQSPFAAQQWHAIVHLTARSW